MEPDQQNQPVSQKRLPQWLMTVTPLSKSLAMILFITIPFLGFCLGMLYQQKVNVNTPVVSEVKKTVAIIPTPIPISTSSTSPTSIPSPTVDISAWKTFRNTEYGIEFQYPSSLTATQVHQKYINLIGRYPTSKDDIVMPMLISENTNNLSLTDYYIMSLGAGTSPEELKNHLNFQEVTVGNRSGLRVVQDGKFFSQQSTPHTNYLINIKSNSIVNIKTGEYTGVFNGTSTSLKISSQNNDTYVKILSTFKFD